MKHLIYFILFFSNLYSNSHFITDYVSENHHDFKELSYKDYKNKILSEFTIKFKLDLEKLADDKYYLQIVSNRDSLIYTNVKYEVINNIIYVKLDKNQKDEIYFQYKYKEPKIAEFRSKYISSFEYEQLLQYEGILYGIAYGIIFCAFLYYLIIYFSTKMRCFLYYSLMQFFVLLSLIGFVYFSYKSYAPTNMQALVDIAETLSFLFTLLFTRTILKTKERMPWVHNILGFFLVLNILDLIAILIYKESILYFYMPFYIGILIPAIAGMIAIFKGDKNAIVYTIGWLVVSIFIYLAQFYILKISGIYVVHIGIPLESLIFSFALGYMLHNLVKEKNEKEKLLIHQSKLASMGEMINNIAHQWRQPLSHLGFINMNLELDLDLGKMDNKYLKQKLQEANSSLDFMSKTIDNFRDFYKPNKEKEIFYISVAIQKAIDIMLPIFKDLKIDFEFEIKNDKELNSYENEYSQVILNLLTNAKDILIEKNIENPKIKVVLDVKDKISIVSISDNGGGIEQKNIDLIFDPYFTTKQKGSGIGLYMSRIIIESHFKGKIEVENQEFGAVFLIKI